MTNRNAMRHDPGPHRARKGPRSLGVMLVTASAVGFALNTPLAALYFAGGGQAVTVIAARSSVAALLALLLLLATGQRLRVVRKFRLLVMFAALMLGIQGLSYVGSVAYIPVGLAALLFFTWPIMMALASPLAGGPRITAIDGVAFLIAFAGLALALGPSMEILDWRGVALAFLGAVSVPAFLFAYRAGVRHMPMPVLAFYTNLGVAVICVPAAFLSGGSDPASPGMLSDLLPLGLICLAFVCGLGLQLMAMRHADPPTIAIVYNIEPIISILAAVLLLGEIMTRNQYLGGALVLTGLFVYALKQARKGS